jgi:hypothetical protein
VANKLGVGLRSGRLKTVLCDEFFCMLNTILGGSIFLGKCHLVKLWSGANVSCLQICRSHHRRYAALREEVIPIFPGLKVSSRTTFERPSKLKWNGSQQLNLQCAAYERSHLDDINSPACRRDVWFSVVSLKCQPLVGSPSQDHHPL